MGRGTRKFQQLVELLVRKRRGTIGLCERDHCEQVGFLVVSHAGCFYRSGFCMSGDRGNGDGG